jgi:tetratricopeptide (TPR) repeat protein
MYLWLLLTTLLTSVIALWGQDRQCDGPMDLVRTIKAAPSSAAYNALGAQFAQQREFSCAIRAFESGLRLDSNSFETRYNLGLALLENGEYKRAATELRIVVRQKADLLAAHNALAAALREVGQLDGAEAEFTAALKIDPQSVYALEGLTKIQLEQKRYASVIRNLRDAPRDNGLRLNLAIAYASSGKEIESVKILQELAILQPHLAIAHFNLASVYAQQKRFQEAADEYGQTLRLDPSNDVARIALVKALTVLAQYSEALPLVEDYTRRKPADHEGHLLLGTLYRELGKYGEGQKELEQAVAMRPHDFESRFNLGFVLAKQGKAAEALPHLQRAKELNPDSSETRFQLIAVFTKLKQFDRATEERKVFSAQKEATLKENIVATKGIRANQYLETGDAQRAVDGYREALREDPKNARTYYNLALALERLNDRTGERQALERSVELDGRLALVQNQLALLDLEEGKIGEAERRFNIALSLDPRYAESQSNLGVLYGRAGKNKQAEEMFRRAIENDPGHAQAYLNLGLILASQDRFAEAEAAIQNALRIAPKHVPALTAIGIVEVRLGHRDLAMESFRKIIALDPGSSEAHLNLGIALADGFDLEAALVEFSESARLAPNSPMARYNQGRSLFDLRRNDESKAELEAAVHLKPDYASPMYLLGLIEKEAGNVRRAVELLERVVALEPRNADALYALGKVHFQLGNSAEAVARWKQVLQISPNRAEPLYNLARALAESDPAGAREYQERFTELQRKQRITDRAATLGNFAIAAAAARDWAQAIAQLKEALEVCGECHSRADLHKNLGLIYCRSGNTKDGTAELLAAKKLKPCDPDIEAALRLLRDLPQQALVR